MLMDREWKTDRQTPNERPENKMPSLPIVDGGGIKTGGQLTSLICASEVSGAKTTTKNHDCPY